LIAIKMGISLFEITQCRLGEEEVKRIVHALPEIRVLPANWNEDSSLPHIEGFLKQVPKGSRSIAFLDHLHLVSVPGARIGDATGTVGHVLLTIKRAAMDLKIPIVVGCHSTAAWSIDRTNYLFSRISKILEKSKPAGRSF
jgi:hypothetical protein